MQSWVLSPPIGWMTSWREGGLPGCHSSRPEKLFYCLSEAEKLSQFAAFFSGSACFKHPTPFVLLCYYFESIWQRNCRLIGILQNTAFSLVKGRLALGSPGCRSFVRHHAENGPIHRKMVVDCPLVIISKVKLFFRPDKTRKKEWMVQPVFCIVDAGSCYKINQTQSY